jgi:hypothetical protein
MANSRNDLRVVALLCIVTLSSLVYYFIRQFGPPWRAKVDSYVNYTPFITSRVEMPIDGQLFWEKKSLYHGLDHNSIPIPLPQTPTCNNFFASWPGDCVDKAHELHDRLKVFSAQMVIMNATLTLFVSGFISITILLLMAVFIISFYLLFCQTTQT